MKYPGHIPFVDSIDDFFALLNIGRPRDSEISVTRIEDQPEDKKTEVPLFRNNIFRIIYLNAAEVAWDLPTSHLEAQDQCVYFAYPGKLESWSARADNRGFVLCFTREFAADFGAPGELDLSLPYFQPEGQSLLFLQPEATSEIILLLERMHQEAANGGRDRKRMLKFQLYQLLIILHRHYAEKMEQLPGAMRNNQRIYHQFRQEVEQYMVKLAAGEVRQQLSVRAIADRLALTPGYLGAVIKEVTGRPAVSHINEKTVLEAKSYLLHTNLPMADIADRLGFNTVSYFSRFFRKHTHQSPGQYRRTH